ncbi:MAG: DinB family protein [bacterium]
MSSCQIIRDNILFLRQGIDLLEELNDEIYVKAVEPFFNSGIGKHIRHNLDHYELFLGGLQAGYIDYDGRRRDRQVETDRHYATQKMLSIISRLEGIEAQSLDDSISVQMNENAGSSPHSQSTIRRELQFLVSHTVHHYALIAIILKIQGFEYDKDFGVAPSTLKYQRSQQTKCVLSRG